MSIQQPEINHSQSKKFADGASLFGVVLFGCALCAQTAPATQSIVTPERIAELEQKIAEAHGAADNGWMLVVPRWS